MLKRFCLFFFTSVFPFSSLSLMASEDENLSATPPHRNIAAIERTQEVDKVLFLIQKQLVIMHEVARWKWNHKAEIEDLAQEQQMLTKMGKLAAAYGLNKEWALKFFHAQLNAGKTIQYRDYDCWQKENMGDLAGDSDLHTEIRPYLDRLTKELLEALVDFPPGFKGDETESLILELPPLSRGSDFIEEDVWQEAIAPLYEYTP